MLVNLDLHKIGYIAEVHSKIQNWKTSCSLQRTDLSIAGLKSKIQPANPKIWLGRDRKKMKINHNQKLRNHLAFSNKWPFSPWPFCRWPFFNLAFLQSGLFADGLFAVWPFCRWPFKSGLFADGLFAVGLFAGVPFFQDQYFLR